MLMTPPVPAASYFAPGLDITSILCIWEAGMDCNASATLLPKITEGFPLIKKRMLGFPRNSTFPFASTDTCGTFLSTSVAAPLWEVTSFSTLILYDQFCFQQEVCSFDYCFQGFTICFKIDRLQRLFDLWCIYTKIIAVINSIPDKFNGQLVSSRQRIKNGKMSKSSGERRQK